MSILETANNIFNSIIGGNIYSTTLVTSSIDGKQYKVRDMPDKQEAANLMARLRMRLMKITDTLEQKYPDKPQVKHLVKNFRSDPSRFIEATPDSEHTSYSINKGEQIYMCLRQREGPDESLVNENVMTFVSLHELAHVCTESIGHGPDFWNNFGWLLKEAEALELYQYTDFQAHPVSYCGVYITDSPRYDPAKDGNNFQIGTMSKRVN
jgi:predicted metal-dependent hydrolase